MFLGQSVSYPGNAIFKTLVSVPAEKKLELPVAEDMQLGLSIGLSLNGITPISIFPRMDFLMCAMNQLVNHLDKIEEMGAFSPTVLVRVAVGSTKPLYPGPQHCGDYTAMLKYALKNVKIYPLYDPSEILETYKKVYEEDRSAVMIEYQDLYGTG